MLGPRLRSWLALPLTAGRSVDDPATTELRRSIIRGRAPLFAIYRDWYREIVGRLPGGSQPVLELGSGGGFLHEALPDLITSDVLRLTDLDVVLDATHLPFADNSLRGIVMVNVFHHLMSPRRFLSEAARCIVPLGTICMVEPWATQWSRRVYALHSEPFDPGVAAWDPCPGGPLSGGNGALPWVVFRRDRATLEAEFPGWELAEVHPIMPFRYLLSGGVSMRQLAPSWAFPPLAALEQLVQPLRHYLAMFAVILLRRRESPERHSGKANA